MTEPTASASFETYQTTLSSLVPKRTAGALPSCRTEGMLANALASDNIDEVKAQLMHVWAHYQSLELLLHNREYNSGILALAKEETPIHDLDDADLALGFFATGAIEVAYDNAHAVTDILDADLAETVPQALRVIYPDNDYSDPERDLVDNDIEDLLKAVFNDDAE